MYIEVSHCLQNRTTNSVVLIVGEYDTKLGNDTNTTALYRLRQIIIHPNFDTQTLVNDIALVLTTNNIMMLIEIDQFQLWGFRELFAIQI
jgi:hypothetical protein